MRRFSKTLKKLYNRLNLPQPAKSRILLEIANDMNDCYHYYKSQGYSDSEASEKTEEKFDLSDDALTALIDIHQSLFRKFLDKLSTQARTKWERIVLFMILLLIISFSTKTILTNQFFIQASKFIWGILGVSLIIVILSVIKVYTLYVKEDHNLKRLNTGLPALFFCSCSSIIIGIFGSFIEFYNTLTRIQFELNKWLIFFVDLLLKSTSLLIVSLLVTIISAVIWFLLSNKVARIQRAEAVVLLTDS